ncbi:MAG TPA: hypothetical protein VF240_21680 [Pyrinomonadaceae bacterium]
MAVTENTQHKRRYKFGKRRGKKETAELSARLAPLEETAAADKMHQAVPEGLPVNDDTIRVNTAALNLPERLVEEERTGARIFYLDPIVVAILVFMLAFIAFIAWRITLMPAK